MTVLIIGIFAQGTNIHSQHNMEPSQTQAYTVLHMYTSQP